MDFKARLNSCGRFRTDESFKKIIMKNSCRLRQNSAVNQKDIIINTESNRQLKLNKINNIKVLQKQQLDKKDHFLKTEHLIKSEIKIKEKKKTIFPKDENKKHKKYYRHKSDLMDNNKDNKNKNNITNNIVNKNQENNVLKLSKNHKNHVLKINDNDIDKNINIINNNGNNAEKTEKRKSLKKEITENNEKKEQNAICKSNTVFNSSHRKRRNVLMKRITNEIDKKKIKNIDDIKRNNNFIQNKTNCTTLNNSLFNKNKNNKITETYSTEVNNSKKNINHYTNKENYKFKKQPKINRRNKHIHNSMYLFPMEISSANDKDKDKSSNKKEDEEKDNHKIKKNISDFYELTMIDDFINSFFCELIDLSNSIEEKSLFDILLNNFNKKYIFNYVYKSFPISHIRFTYCYKYFCTLITPLLFLSKDDDLYKYDSIKGHLLINQFIYSSLYYIGINFFNIPKIQNFITKYNGSKKVPIIHSTTSFIKLIFEQKKEYEPLKAALIQLTKNIINESVDNIIKILNNTILFCFNNKNKQKEKLYYPFFKKKAQTNNEENSKNSESTPSAPFIKSSMKKEFCLVLDIDETISHSMKLSFGYYFLLRPGTIDFLNELSNYYEIDIFTSSLKHYADFIINKIDPDGNLISYRLYKHHVTYENGKSVKNLNMIGRDLNKIIFVDNLKYNAKYNLKNLCLISSWTNDIYDDELIKLKDKLKYIATSGKFNDDITKGL